MRWWGFSPSSSILRGELNDPGKDGTGQTPLAAIRHNVETPLAGVWLAGVWLVGVWLAGVWLAGVWQRASGNAPPATHLRQHTSGNAPLAQCRDARKGRLYISCPIWQTFIVRRRR